MFKKHFLIWLLISILLCSGCLYPIDTIEVPEASVVFDIKGRPIKGLAEENRISIDFEEIPESFKAAIIAVEDKKFYSHHGLDFTGILRAVFMNLKAGKITAGGSTITQQTAKTLFLSNERTISRKIKELFYALELERRYSKDEILTRYCNSIYFGHGAYGLEVAAQTFFNKSARDLNLEESALLAGLPNAPSLYDPYINPQAAKQRQGVVLQRMVEEGYISERERDIIEARELNYQAADYVVGEAPYFIAMVRDYLSSKYGDRMVYQGGLRAYTTLDLDMQKAANKAYQEGMQEREANVQAALVALDVSNGHIRALIGGRNFALSTYNRVFSERQPGSTFKPFLYSLALERGMNQAQQIKCERVEFGIPNGDIYVPEDYGKDKYHWKEFTLKEALMISDNVIAVRLNDSLGPEHVAKHAEKFGFKDIKPILSLPLGSKEVSPLSMAAAYCVFANEGIYSQPSYILKVVDRHGQILEEADSIQRRVVSPQNAYLINDMLRGVLEPGGTGARLQALVGRPAAGKTGTTDDYNDAWFVGYTPQLCCAVWVGYDKGRNVNLVGSVAAGPIWANFLREASAPLLSRDFTKPDDIQTKNICLDSGLVATESCPRSMAMAFQDDTQPQEICYLHSSFLNWLFGGDYDDDDEDD